LGRHAPKTHMAQKLQILVLTNPNMSNAENTMLKKSLSPTATSFGVGAVRKTF